MSLETSQDNRRLILTSSAALLFGLLIIVGVFARNGWLPSTDSLSGKRATWLVQIFADPATTRKREQVWAAYGVNSARDLDIDRDNRAEKVAIPVVTQSFANRQKEIPKGIQKAIDKLLKN